MIYIVTGSAAATHVRKIPGFTIDLGRGIMNADTVTFYDNIVKEHATLFDRLIHKYGTIGKLAFFTDTMYPHNRVAIFDGKKSYSEDVDWSRGSTLEVVEDFLAKAKAELEKSEQDDNAQQGQLSKEERVRLAREASKARRENNEKQ